MTKECVFNIERRRAETLADGLRPRKARHTESPRSDRQSAGSARGRRCGRFLAARESPRPCGHARRGAAISLQARAEACPPSTPRRRRLSIRAANVALTIVRFRGRNGQLAQQTMCVLVVEPNAAGVRRVLRSPSFAIASFDFLNRSSDVDEGVVTASAEPRSFRCRFSKPSTMPDCQGGLRARKHDRPEEVRHRQHRHAGAPPDAAGSTSVDDYWAFCRFSRNLVAPAFDA
jgi:hypothetical protein